MEMRVSVVAGSPGQQTGIDWKPFLGAWPPRRCGWLWHWWGSQWSLLTAVECAVRGGLGTLAWGSPVPLPSSGQPTLSQGVKAVAWQQVSGRRGSENIPRAPGPETRGEVKPLSCNSAPRVVPQWLDLLRVRCASSAVFCSAPSCCVTCHLAQGLRGPQMFCRPQAASTPYVEEPSTHHPHPRLHPGRASTLGSRLQLQNGSEPSFKCVDS